MRSARIRAKPDALDSVVPAAMMVALRDEDLGTSSAVAPSWLGSLGSVRGGPSTGDSSSTSPGGRSLSAGRTVRTSAARTAAARAGRGSACSSLGLNATAAR